MAERGGIKLVPSVSLRRHYRLFINEKDAHVLAAAIAREAPYLLTLDQAFQDEANRARLPIRALSPGEFIGELSSHPTFSRLRD